MSTNEQLLAAVEMYLDRKNRVKKPSGRSVYGTGVWYPDSSEAQSCCNSIRSPSRAYPFSLFKHCLTVDHIARLHDVSATDIRRVSKLSIQESISPLEALLRYLAQGLRASVNMDGLPESIEHDVLE